MPTRRSVFFAPLLVATLACVTGCAAAAPAEEPERESATPAATRAPTPGPTPIGTAEPATEEQIAAAMAEREAFIREQGLPLDGSPLVAVTPAQRAFIAEQRAYVESQGGTWDAQSESLSLALTADACETAILNYHRVDASVLQVHVASSPLFTAIIPGDLAEPERLTAERNVASIMVFGTGFLCPDDASGWQQAFAETYG
jgi:pyruvate/2-oxoglutarate dehydrogenase complex dihydrolipoamide acyltransferase (E2) component